MTLESLYLLPNRDSPVRWRDRLVDEIGLIADPAESYRLVFSDSFDWLLYHAGRRLEWQEHPDYTLMRLLRLADGTTEAELELEAVGTRFACELPASELRRIIEPLLDIRAFLPLATLKIRSHCLRLEDDEGKTRARLYVETISRLTETGGTRLMQ